VSQQPDERSQPQSPENERRERIRDLLENLARVVAIVGGIAAIIFGVMELRRDPEPTPIPATLTPTEVPVTLTPTPAPQVQIVHIEYKPATEQDQEYVELKNNGSEEQPLMGWRLEDKDDHSFDFPDFTLKPGASVKIWTCVGTNGPSDLYWQRGSAVWNNDRPDTATLRDDLGVIIATRTYDP
jgi:hypothetical protein